MATATNTGKVIMVRIRKQAIEQGPPKSVLGKMLRCILTNDDFWIESRNEKSTILYPLITVNLPFDNFFENFH
jgi:hypothetical protein